MTRNSIPISTVLRSLALTAAIALALVLASAATAQTSGERKPIPATSTVWTISVIGIGKSSPTPLKPTYSVDRVDTNGGCKYQNTDAANLEVCPNDTVVWKAVNPDDSPMNPSEMVLYFIDDIVSDPHGRPSHGFQASNGNPTTGGKIVSKTPYQGYKYDVLLLDKKYNTTYYDDPKIFVGGGTVRSWVLQLNDIISKIKRLDGKSESEKEPVKDILDDLDRLKKDLEKSER
jgi:hypothetical protein